ncbi:MAG: response regulator transcription factor [Acidobacteriota bacterium]
MRVLIVEDNRDIAANIGDYLAAHGALVDYAYDGLGGLHLALTTEPEVIVLDIGLPGMDGLTFCQRLRQDAGKATPVLMLTARDTLDDKVAGFDAGTDDYLVKPFALQELWLRLQALVRRAQPAVQRLRIGDLELDPGARTARRGAKSLSLGKTAFDILEALMRKSPNVVTRRDLEAALWGDDPPDGDVLRSHIYTLRKAIDRSTEGPPLLQTVHGVGYRLVAPEVEPSARR